MENSKEKDKLIKIIEDYFELADYDTRDINLFFIRMVIPTDLFYQFSSNEHKLTNRIAYRNIQFIDTWKDIESYVIVTFYYLF